jgi:hypothetical protein
VEWARAYEQLTAGSPLAIGVALVWVALNTRKALIGSMGRIGARVGRLEQGRIADQEAARLERVRRWQLEAALIAVGTPIPPWPDHSDDVPAPTPRHTIPEWSPSR